jgi:prepilin-type N-terminal cleavage/methylation domain-containing protein
MPTSASSRLEVMSRGFTLVELLVVMLMVGLITALVAPNLATMLAGVQRVTYRDRIISDMSSLSFRAFTLGQSFELTEVRLSTPLRDGSPLLVLPSGWRLRTEAPVRFSFNGTCSGGAVELVAPDGVVERLLLNAPDCRISPN